jgi:signal transduction histidine kinase
MVYSYIIAGELLHIGNNSPTQMENELNFYLGIIIVIVAFVIIATGLALVFVRYQKRLLFKQKELHELELQHKQDLLSSTIKSSESERMRIAKEVHDEIGNIFSTLSLTVNQMQEGNTIKPEELEISRKLIKSGITGVRRISHALIPFELELFGLQQTLENHFETVSSVSIVKFELEINFNLKSLNNDVALAIYRIIQEYTSNCIKYSGAENAWITIGTNEINNMLLLNYRDNGIGMNIEDQKLNKGIGLKNIESRALSLGGTFNVTSEMNKGFSSTITIPLTNNTLL